MKVGTDGTLLGAWANGGRRILDVGTGTGLIALMMAQRFPEAGVTAIDIDHDACMQAAENVENSVFSSRIVVVERNVVDFSSPSLFDAIVSNPPYYNRSLACSNLQRTVARHCVSLSYRELIAAAWRLLDEEGELSVVIPFDYKNSFDSEAVMAGFFKSRECAVRTNLRKAPRRYLLAYRKHQVCLEKTEGIIEDAPHVRSAWYSSLTKDFYL